MNEREKERRKERENEEWRRKRTIEVKLDEHGR